MDKSNKTTNRNFGIVFFIFFILVGFFPILNQESIRLWSIIISFIFLSLGLLNSILLTPLNGLWHQLGLFLGKNIAPLVMGIIYFVVVFPTFLFLKVFKRNYLNIKFNKNIKSYWTDTCERNSTMKDQF